MQARDLGEESFLRYVGRLSERPPQVHYDLRTIAAFGARRRPSMRKHPERGSRPEPHDARLVGARSRIADFRRSDIRAGYARRGGFAGRRSRSSQPSIPADYFRGIGCGRPYRRRSECVRRPAPSLGRRAMCRVCRFAPALAQTASLRLNRMRRGRIRNRGSRIVAAGAGRAATEDRSCRRSCDESAAAIIPRTTGPPLPVRFGAGGQLLTGSAPVPQTGPVPVFVRRRRAGEPERAASPPRGPPAPKCLL